MFQILPSPHGEYNNNMESLFNKVAGLLQAFKACNFIKKRLQHSCFPVNIAKFLRTAFFIEHLRWPPLYNYFQY